LASLAKQEFEGRVLVEKPLLAAPGRLPAAKFARRAVGYNLRFHPVVAALRSALANRRIQTASFQVGQWLADWRPARNVEETYSARRVAGGGVLRDLSHELDLTMWLFGNWTRVVALGGRFGQVTVDSDDAWGVLLSCSRNPLVTLQMNYLDRMGRRAIVVQSDGVTFHADLIANTLNTNGQVTHFNSGADITLAAMHEAMLGEGGDVCTFEEGLKTVDLILAIERAAASQSWIRSEGV
jgi:predicted dehydrogenase